MRRGPVAVIAALLVLAVAPSAHADVTIGSSLAAEPNVAIPCPTGCTASPTAIAGRAVAAPAAGVITRWRVRAGSTVSPVRLVVIRRPAGTGNQPGDSMNRSATVDPAPDAVTEFDAQIPISAGDYIGLDFIAGAFVHEGSVASLDRWEPTLVDGASPTGSTSQEVLVAADIEPDGDGDGSGDETQDNDDDADGVDDGDDNCPAAANAGQEDMDGDGEGDVCDGDRDGDGVANAADVCPGLAGVAPGGCPAPPAAPRVNTPPVVRFRTPMSGTAVRVSHAIELDVVDDAGEPTVTVFDDDGTICTLSGPPYSCTWRPTGADVGRATLLASAVDSDNRSTLGIVRVTVARFPADLTRRVRGRRVRGRLVLPAAVERALGCRGKVTVRRGRARRTVALKRNCKYSARLPTRRGKARARFEGNSVVAPAT